MDTNNSIKGTYCIIEIYIRQNFWKALFFISRIAIYYNFFFSQIMYNIHMSDMIHVVLLTSDIHDCHTFNKPQNTITKIIYNIQIIINNHKYITSSFMKAMSIWTVLKIDGNFWIYVLRHTKLKINSIQVLESH